MKKKRSSPGRQGNFDESWQREFPAIPDTVELSRPYATPPMHCHVPPNWVDHPLCIVDHATEYEATEPRYMAWKYGTTLQGYRIGADLCQTLTFSDWDWVRYWIPEIQDYGDTEPIADGWRNTYDDLFQFNGEGQPYYSSPTMTGSITYWVLWIDDNYPLGTHDPDALDSAPIAVVNNTYAGWSSIAAPQDDPPTTITYGVAPGRARGRFAGQWLQVIQLR